MAENYKDMDDFKKEGEKIAHKNQLLASFSKSELDLGVFSNSKTAIHHKKILFAIEKRV